MQRLDSISNVLQSSLSAGSTGLALPLSSTENFEVKPCREEYPEVMFWHRNEWDTHVQIAKSNQTWRQNTAKEATCDALAFIMDANGTSINGYGAIRIRQYARQLWQSLAKAGRDPPNWGNADASAVKFFRTHMYTEFPDLRLCENDWKVDMIAQKDYPSWHRSHGSENSKNLKRQVKRSMSNSPELSDHDEGSNTIKKLKISQPQESIFFSCVHYFHMFY